MAETDNARCVIVGFDNVKKGLGVEEHSETRKEVERKERRKKEERVMGVEGREGLSLRVCRARQCYRHPDAFGLLTSRAVKFMSFQYMIG